MSEKRELKVIKAKDVKPPPSRSELTLLWELIQRNPERAREFLRRLGESMKAAA
jgi:hypothetical protein